jgi:putative ABC transport system permease protein
LIDAALLRPLPVADPRSLYVALYKYVNDTNGRTEEGESFSYPLFREFREAVRDQADTMMVNSTGSVDVIVSGGQDREKAGMQYVSGNYFALLGLQPAAGRLFTADDDLKPGAHPVAVLSDDYWARRFARDPRVIGRTLRWDAMVLEVVGVAPAGFTGTETGTVTDFFVPAMQNADAIAQADWSWARVWMRLKAGSSPERVRQVLERTFAAHRRERLKEWPADIAASHGEAFVRAPLVLRSAAAGASYTQKQYREALYVLGSVVVLVLLIACANVANLLTAQAAARAKEMALRVSIGAGRARLVQLMLIECLLLAGAATVIGGVFAWWAAPFVVGMINPPDDPIRLSMPADWRVLAFLAAVTLAVTILFGLAPALRASAVRPASALKGGDNPHSRRRLMNSLVAAQVAFCFVVHFAAGLFVTTFERLSHQPLGFNADRLLLLETAVSGSAGSIFDRGRRQRPQAVWQDIATSLGGQAGVESVAYATWALMSGSGWTTTVRVGGRPKDDYSPYFLAVSPGWLETMRIGMIDGRDFRIGELPARPDDARQPMTGPAIVNEAFARRYFDGANPIGKAFEMWRGERTLRNVVVGYVRDARYRSMREALPPTAYLPFDDRNSGTFIVRTRAGVEPLSLAQPLRRLVSQVRPEYVVSETRTQAGLVRNNTIRERLLATLSMFFAGVALILAAVGLYGVMHYAVEERRREIGIRMALGARATHIVRQVSRDVFAMLGAGASLGLVAGLASERYVKTLLYGVRGADAAMLATPLVVLAAAALFAALPPALNAVHTDPVSVLRGE